MATSWRIGAPYGADKVEIVTTDGGQAVAIVWVKRGVPDRETGREVFVDDLAGIGRARLIAAAPDLLEALNDVAKFAKLYRGRMENVPGDEALEALADTVADAIAKAEG